MNNSAFKRLLFYDNLLESKFRFRKLNFWPYCRQFFYQYILKFGITENLIRKSYPFKNIKSVILSHFKIRRSDTIFLISNRPQIISLIQEFRSNEKYYKNEKPLFICDLGYDSSQEIEFIYSDLAKIISRGIFLFSKKSLSNVIKRSFIEAILLYIYFKLLFFLIRPKTVFFINWYNFYPALLALPSNSSKIEIQHGIIHNEHPGYNYGVKDSKNLIVPNNFELWSDIYAKNINLGKKFNFSIISRNAFSDKIKATKRNFVIIISQHTIRQKIDKEILKNYEILSSYGRIIYRIHPKDRSIIEDIKKIFENYENILVVSSDEDPIEFYLNPTNVFVGVFSTLFVDCILAGYKCIVLNIQEKDVIKHLFKRENLVQF